VIVDVSTWVPYAVLSNIAATWGVGFYAHILSKNKATTDRMERLETEIGQRLGVHSERLARLDSLMDQMPNHADLGKLYDRLNDQSRDVARMAGEMAHMNDNLRMLLHQLKKEGS
jgi:hypothetical protein